MPFALFPPPIAKTRLLPGRVVIGLFLLCLLLASCAKSPEPEAPFESRAATLWNAFATSPALRAGMPSAVLVRVSLKIESPTDKHRVLATLFGNPNSEARPGTMRLDVSAGVGAQIGSWREDRTGTAIYLPQEGDGAGAYHIFPPGSAGFEAMGVATPISLSQLAALVSGRLGELIPPTFHWAEPGATSAEIVYGLVPADNPAKAGRLVLSRDDVPTGPDGAPLAPALPVRIEDVPSPTGGADWTLTFSRFTAEPGQPPRPGKLLLERRTTAGPESVTVFVKEVQEHESPYSVDALALPPPPGARIMIHPEQPLP